MLLCKKREHHLSHSMKVFLHSYMFMFVCLIVFVIVCVLFLITCTHVFSFGLVSLLFMYVGLKLWDTPVR